MTKVDLMTTWFRDLLSVDLPEAQTMTFEYGSKVSRIRIYLRWRFVQGSKRKRTRFELGDARVKTGKQRVI
jgi:hypothetical protein